MADNLFQVEIITPDRVFYHGDASMIEFTTTEGEIGVYKDHIPLTTVLAPGIVTITEPEGAKRAVVHAGFAEILGEWPDEIDLDRARRAEDRARDRLNRKDANLDVARAELALKRALVRQDILA